MNCLTLVRYAILINGQPTGYITPTRGIRQGDPLSPYLFILCAEGLSAMISKAVACQFIKGLVMCHGALTLHHLFFADDNFLFGSATEIERQRYRSLLNIYEQPSGQRINLQKSSVAFSKNVHSDLKTHLAIILGVSCVQEHDKYLGLPIHVGRSKYASFAYLKERLTKKLIS